MATKRNRTTTLQFQKLVEYLENNKELLQNKGLKKNADKWKELRDILNLSGRGPAKSIKEWKRVLIEWKYNTKRKIKYNFINENYIKPLSNLEERFLKLLEETSENLHSEVPFVQIFVEGNYENVEGINTTEDYEIKTENNQESNILIEENIPMESMKNNSKQLSTINVETPVQMVENEGTINLNRYQRSNMNKSKNKKIFINRNTNRNIEMKKLKSKLVLAKANYKLAESNLKIAESNDKIAMSFDNLANVLKLYTDLKLKEMLNKK